ncbi:hypothetical protein U9R90_19335 [Streptomyces sp. E11-3]|uniref:hypothetical protein n=1 Tax=Streptomyces sp. E11-3 TaxID=3110112 RepID=UPI003980BF97
MGLDTTRTSGPIRTRRSLALLIATGAGLGSLLLGTVPAHANATTKHVASDGQSVAFKTSDSSKRVRGKITFTVKADGNWSINADAHNPRPAGRNVRWTCDLSWDASSVRNSTGKTWVPRKKTRTLTAAAYDPYIQADFAKIVDRGTADCDIVIG